MYRQINRFEKKDICENIPQNHVKCDDVSCDDTSCDNASVSDCDEESETSSVSSCSCSSEDYISIYKLERNNRSRDKECTYKKDRAYKKDCDKEKHKNKSVKKCETVCDKLHFKRSKNAHEKRRVVHKFKVVLGKCKVTRDVEVTHCITANLDHHIKEYRICKHAPCTKYTHEDKHKSVNGDFCKVKFPDSDDQIKYISKNNDCSEIKECRDCYKRDCTRTKKHKG